MILFFLLFIVLAVVIERWSIKHSLDGVKYEMKLSRQLVEPDEQFEIIGTIRNTSRRFIPFIRLSESVPRTLKVSAKLDVGSFSDNIAKLNSTMYAMPRQKITRRLTGSFEERGRYLFNGATMFGGDFLGLSENPRYFLKQRECIVLPRRLDPADFSQTFGGFLGDISVNRFILEDPVLTLGFRDYTGREPMKQISWTATARMGKLMVKNYDHTLEITVTVVLNIFTKLYGYAAHPLIEKCYSMARGVCEELEEKHISYSFCTNARAVGMNSAWDYVPDGLGIAHLNGILEGLGRASYSARQVSEDLLESAKRRAENGRAHIIITPTNVEYDEKTIDSLRNYTGAQVLLLYAEEVH